jgi:hypothetical protein
MQQPLEGQGLLCIEPSQSRSKTLHLIGLLWGSDQTVTETLPDNAQHSQKRDIMPPAGFEAAVPACELPQAYTVDSAATEII